MLRVPWWAVQGFSADRTEIGPDGRHHQVMEIVTDAGVLELLCPAPEVGGVIASLSAWARRWRLARSPLARPALRAAALAVAVVRHLAFVAWPLVAAERGASSALRHLGRGLASVLPPLGRILVPVARPLAAAGSPLGRPLAPVGRLVARRPISVLAVAAAVSVWMAVMLGGAQALPAARVVSADAGSGFDASGMSKIMSMAEWEAAGSAAKLPAASAPPPPAPASLADEAPLVPHEVFGFAPYWTIGEEATFDVQGFSTIAYFSLTANGNGTLQQSGTGWDGYESQAFADLVARAHAAGVRVVLTVNCFAQSTLDQITSSPSAQQTLAQAVVSAVQAKNLDGVNIDFEGEGSADQAGLTSLVATVAGAVRAADPHYQLTMDTYASSAGDPGGFYDIPALAPIVDGFFVMSYDLNLSAAASAASPITSTELSDETAAAQYAAVVPPSKVILGTSYFGYVWPTTNGTMAAQPTATPTPISYAQVKAAGYPLYWDAVTDTAWTSYQVGSQWYEVYFEDPASIYLVAHLAQTYDLAGVGAWAMGMDGNDPQMTQALDGNAQPVVGGSGPSSTSASPPSPPLLMPIILAPAPGTVAAPSPAAAGSGSGAKSTATGSIDAGTIAPPSSTTSTTGGSGSQQRSDPAVGGTTTTTTTTSGTSTTQAPGGGTRTYRYSGVVEGQTVSLTEELATTPMPAGTPTFVGTLSDFTTTDPALSCLSSSPLLVVVQYPGESQDVVVARAPLDCASADFTFPASALGSAHAVGTGAASAAVASSPTSLTDQPAVAPATSTTPTTSGG